MSRPFVAQGELKPRPTNQCIFHNANTTCAASDVAWEAKASPLKGVSYRWIGEGELLGEEHVGGGDSAALAIVEV
jgi:hypothetical protein